MKEASSSFFKKRTKKLQSFEFGAGSRSEPIGQSFFASFCSQKEDFLPPLQGAA
ncbi:MAG: hypothetical protein J0H91_11465 [Rhodospirillales bacterium]|nr:hypothetical protein [Rhodospirillales bacterium]